MAILKVTKASGSTVELPDPSSLEVSLNDLDASSSGRNQKGTMIRDRVAVKRKVSCEWSALKSDDMSTILDAIEDQFFTLYYPDPKTGTSRTITVYAGDRTAPMLSSTGNMRRWSGLTVDFIEK